MIILTRAEAEYVLGISPIDTHGASALEPAPLTTGEYILPEDVLADPANVDVEPFLSALAVRDPIPPEQQFNFGTMEDPDEAAIAAYNAARLTWSEPTDERASVERAARVKLPAASRKRISGKR